MSTIKVNRIENTATTAGGIDINSSGNVGVGTSSFTASSSGRQILEINGTSGSLINLDVGGTRKAYHFTDGTHLYSYNTANGNYIFGTNDTERLRILNNGKVAIGSTSPEFKFMVADAGYSGIEIKSNRTGASENIGGLHFKTGSTSVAYIQSLVDGTLRFRNTSSLSERMRIDSSGRLLVGLSSTFSYGSTDSQHGRLQMLGNNSNSAGAAIISLGRGQAAASISSGSPLGIICFTDNTGKEFAKITASTDGTAGGANGNPGKLVFSTESTGSDVTPVERMKIDQFGQTKLVSQSGTSTLELRNGTVSGGVHRLLYGLHSASTNTNGTPIYSIFTNGTVGTPSDIRLKKNVETTRDGYLSDLSNLRVVKYHWKTQEDAEPKELGLIAQEVEKIFPGLIHTEGEGDKEVKEIKRSVIPFMLLKALQEAQTKIETLETQHATLLARVTALEAA